MIENKYLHMDPYDFEDKDYSSNWDNWDELYHTGTEEEAIISLSIDYQYEVDGSIYICDDKTKEIHQYFIEVEKYPEKYKVRRIN